MMRRIGAPAARQGFLLLTTIGLLAALPVTAGAAGAWQTHLRVKDVTDLFVATDVVWCATAEAGLLRFDRTTHQFDPFTREPGGLASNHLTCVVIDRIGRLWVGTSGSGVSRLAADGSTWELVNAFDGLPGDSVTTITVAGDTLWIGTRGGIALWDGRQVLGSLPDGNTVSFDTTFVLPAVTGIAQLGDTLWIATPRGLGFARTTSNLTDWRPANAGLPTLDVARLASNGRDLLALAGGAVWRWDPNASSWTDPGSIGVVHNLTSDYGMIQAASEQGVHLWTESGFVRLAGAPAAAGGANDDPEPSVDASGSIHYAANAAGLWAEQPADTVWRLDTPPGPPGNTYSNLAIDGSRLYTTSRDDGIARWDGSSWLAWLPGLCSGACPNTFQNAKEAFALLADRVGQKWVACWRWALDRFDDSGDPPLFTHLWTNVGDDPRHTLAFGSAADSSGGRWFGMDTDNTGVVQPLGLDYYDASGAWVASWGPGSPAGSLVRGGKIRAITVDKAGRIWVGYAGAANSGVDHFTGLPQAPNAEFHTVAGTTSLDVWSLVAHGDSIWVLTDRDLRRINRTSVPPRVVQTLPTPAGRPLGVRLMDVAPNGDVFVGSEEGVRWYRPDGSTQDLTVADSPLASNDVRAVAVDRATGVVWFGTAEGLNRFDPGYQPPGPPPGQADTLRVYPNPATLTGLGIQLRLQGAAAGYQGGIYDLRGRLVHRFTTTRRAQIFWDGRDDQGEQVKPGVYFVRAEGGGRQARARFVLLH
jgi:hypothetical protein